MCGGEGGDGSDGDGGKDDCGAGRRDGDGKRCGVAGRGRGDSNGGDGELRVSRMGVMVREAVLGTVVVMVIIVMMVKVWVTMSWRWSR